VIQPSFLFIFFISFRDIEIIDHLYAICSILGDVIFCHFWTCGMWVWQSNVYRLYSIL